MAETKNGTVRISPAKLQKSKLADQILDTMMDWIMDGTLQMGDRLNTEELAKAMGISRMPVREAISTLEQKGLAYSVPYAGMRLVNLTEEEVTEIYRIRQLLEPEAGFMACKNATEEDLAQIEKCFYEHVAAISTPEINAREVHKKNVAFHMSIFRASHMTHLCGVIEEMWDKLSFFKMIYGESFLRSEDTRRNMIDEHRRYLTYVKNGEADAIKGAIYVNIGDKMKRYENGYLTRNNSAIG